jgi:hypothetical protein
LAEIIPGSLILIRGDGSRYTTGLAAAPSTRNDAAARGEVPVSNARIHRNEKPELGRKLAASIRKDSAGDELVAPWAERLESKSAALDAAMAPRSTDTATSVAATGAASELDVVRDDQWRALYYILLAFATQRHDPALAATAADVLGRLMPGKLAVADFPYARESAEIESTLTSAGTEPIAAALASLPNVAAFVTGLAAAQANFAGVIASTPAARAAIAKAIEAIREAEAEWDGVLAGYLGTLKARFPGKKGKAAREKLELPLREARAKEKSRGTRRRNREPAPAPTNGAPA